MDFFNSEVVRAEMTEIGQLQDEVYRSVFNFSNMGKEDKITHITIMERLLDKQKILYTRLSLSDDPEAKQMQNQIIESAKGMGLPSDVDMNILFQNMSKMLKDMKKSVDNI